MPNSVVPSSRDRTPDHDVLETGVGSSPPVPALEPEQASRSVRGDGTTPSADPPPVVPVPDGSDDEWADEEAALGAQLPAPAPDGNPPGDFGPGDLAGKMLPPDENPYPAPVPGSGEWTVGNAEWAAWNHGVAWCVKRLRDEFQRYSEDSMASDEDLARRDGLLDAADLLEREAGS